MHTSNVASIPLDRAPAGIPWGAVLSMSLCAFVLVTSEFMPVSLLTPIAQDLALTEGQAGQAISVSGLFALITSLFITRLIGGMDRKIVLLSLTALMLGSTAVVALAPNYGILMSGRAVLGIAVGGCWSMSTAVLMRISPPTFVPRAIAFLQGGSALATAVAAPLGSYMGSVIGWRGAFLCVLPLAVIALVWQAVSLPALPERSRMAPRNALGLLMNPRIARAMAAVGLLFAGQFALFTYLRPFMESTAQADVATLSLLLLIMGVSGLIGTSLIGKVIQGHLYLALIVIPILMAGLAALLLLFGSSIIAVGILLTAWGFIATPAPVGWFTWLSQALPDDAEAGGGLMVAIIQLAITAGAMSGGIAYDAGGTSTTFLLSAVALSGAALLAWRTAQSERR